MLITDNKQCFLFYFSCHKTLTLLASAPTANINIDAEAAQGIARAVLCSYTHGSACPFTLAVMETRRGP